MVTSRRFFAAVLAAAAFVTGCGYTRQSLLPSGIKTVYVAPVKNVIDLSGETGEDLRFRVYRPGLEVDVTNAIINRFIFDGQLKIASSERAHAAIEAKLLDYRRDPLRYSEADDVQEYRLSVRLDVVMVELPSRKVLWREILVGDTTYFLSGPRALGEDEAASRAVEDAAKRVVEKTVELW